MGPLWIERASESPSYYNAFTRSFWIVLVDLSRERPHQPLPHLWLQELSSEDPHTLLCRVAVRLLVLLPQCIVSHYEYGRCCIFFACQASGRPYSLTAFVFFMVSRCLSELLADLDDGAYSQCARRDLKCEYPTKSQKA